MLPITAAAVDRFCPDETAEGGPVYLLRVPTRQDVLLLRRDILAAGARQTDRNDIYAALCDGVAAIIADDQVDQCREIIDAVWLVGGVDAQTLDLYRRIESELRAGYQRLNEVEADYALFEEMSVFCAARRFLIGWEGVAIPFAGRGGLATDVSLGAIPQAHIYAIGNRVLTLMNVSEAQAKNSVSPSPSSSTPGLSTAAPTLPTAAVGTSSETTTSETPG